jgi:hypothetical protein
MIKALDNPIPKADPQQVLERVLRPLSDASNIS